MSQDSKTITNTQYRAQKQTLHVNALHHEDMSPTLHHLEILTSSNDTSKWEPVPLGQWIETLTGRQVNVERVGLNPRHFKILLHSTDEEFEGFKTMVGQHFMLH